MIIQVQVSLASILIRLFAIATATHIGSHSFSLIVGGGADAYDWSLYVASIAVFVFSVFFGVQYNLKFLGKKQE